jgi:hypothetical protein
MLRVPNGRPSRLAIVLLAILGSGCHAPVVPLPPELASNPAGAVAAGLSSAPALGSAVAWTDCNLEKVNGQSFSSAPMTVAAGADFTVAGFLFDRDRQQVPSDLRLRVEADAGPALDAPVAGRVRRPDIPEYFKLGAWAETSGFEQAVSAHGLPPGSYHLLLVARVGDATALCDNGRHITVVDHATPTTIPKEPR